MEGIDTTIPSIILFRKGNMYLRLLDINKFIEKNNILEVENSNILSSNRKNFNEKGLWSEIIFGKTGSNDRRLKFGYININTTIINPILYQMLQTISPIIRNILLRKKKYSIKQNIFHEDINGETGLVFLTNSIGFFKFINTIISHDRSSDAEYLDKLPINLMTINKLLVLPAGGLRDISLTKRRQFSTEINDFYEQIISLSNQIKLVSDIETKEILTEAIQRTSLKIQNWIQNQLKGKTGVYRSKILKKSIDYSGRMVAIPNKDIPLGKIGLPWHSVLVLFEPFFIYYLFHQNNNLKQKLDFFLNKDETSIEDIKQFLLSLYRSDKFVPEEIKNYLIQAAKDISKEKLVLCKRDPVISRISYFSAEVEVLSEGRVGVVNPLVCEQLGLDFDGDTISIYPIFTKEATEQAKKLNPLYSKQSWQSPITMSKTIFPFTLDLVSTIYNATKT